MGYTTFTNGAQPALSDKVLNNMQVELMKLVFPIGSTYITQEDVNPSTILKFGTWERFKGKIALGVDEDDTNLNEIGKTGGEKTHTLTISEIPSHNHARAVTNAVGGSAETIAMGNSTSQSNIADFNAIRKTGGGQAHNNMPPYATVGYMWIRRA